MLKQHIIYYVSLLIYTYTLKVSQAWVSLHWWTACSSRIYIQRDKSHQLQVQALIQLYVVKCMPIFSACYKTKHKQSFGYNFFHTYGIIHTALLASYIDYEFTCHPFYQCISWKIFTCLQSYYHLFSKLPLPVCKKYTMCTKIDRSNKVIVQII
jgi:hypothetical protein